MPADGAAKLKPSDISVRMYDVGFGDCFLITFRYSTLVKRNERAVRNMLVDFGSTKRPKPGPTMHDIAQLIAEHTDGELDVVVATHRHKDHVSGFGIAETDPIMTALTPKRVIRPWTDDPDIASDATAPTELDPFSTQFVRTLGAREAWLRELAKAPVGATTGIRRHTVDLAQDQLPNQSSIDRLDDWSASGRGVYVKAGDTITLTELPGVTIDILGPPTLLQAPGLANDAFTHSEFWATQSCAGILAGALADDRQLRGAYAALAAPDGYGEARWILERLSNDRVSQLFNVVRTFDDALNNTSIIMLVTAGSRTLLFTGDAQIEDWSHSLGVMADNSKAGRALRTALADIDLYKVGHHGSRNATPKSLFQLWEPDSRRRTRAPLVTMMSTLPGKHGKKEETAVPKQALVDALTARSTLLRTDTLAADTHYIEVCAHTTGPSGFSQP